MCESSSTCQSGSVWMAYHCVLVHATFRIFARKCYIHLCCDMSARHVSQSSVVKCFVVRRGQDFSTQILKQEVSLTPEMIQRCVCVCASVWVMHIWSVRNKANSALCFSVCSGSWKNKTFKAYNFDALGVPPATGHLHPLLKVRTEIRQIFLEMGWVSLFGSMLSFLVSTVPRVFHWVRFTEMPTNNFIESSFWNFDALFQPQQHPARDAHDTFFLKGVCVCVCCSLVHSYKPCFLLVTAHPTCTDHTHYCCYVTGLTWCTLLHVQILSYHMTFHRTIWNE